MRNIPHFVQIFLLFSLIVLPLITNQAHANSPQLTLPTLSLNKLYQMNIEQTINPATLSHLREVIKKVNARTDSGILIQINTPGGLVSVTKSMITEIGKTNVPFIAVVGPEGASATSAGAILSAAGHQLLMFPGTNIGAATPITMQKDLPKDSRDKAINDLVALVTSLREARGKKISHFDEMVSKAKSYGANEAIELEISDKIINSIDELTQKLNGQQIILNGKAVTLDTSALKIELIEMDFGQKILNFLASPELAYLLFLLGAALIYFELQAPGGFIAGGAGALCLILAGVSFQVIPLNMGGLGLILLSFALFFLEIYVTSFGLLSLAGLAALITGSLFLFRTNDAYFELSKGVIFSVTGAIVVFMGFITFIFLKSRKQLSRNFNDTLPGFGTIIKILDHPSGEHQYQYQIKVKGAIWRAFSNEEFKLQEKVAIEKKDEDNMAYVIKSYQN